MKISLLAAFLILIAAVVLRFLEKARYHELWSENRALAQTASDRGIGLDETEGVFRVSSRGRRTAPEEQAAMVVRKLVESATRTGDEAQDRRRSMQAWDSLSTLDLEGFRLVLEELRKAGVPSEGHRGHLAAMTFGAMGKRYPREALEMLLTGGTAGLMEEERKPGGIQLILESWAGREPEAAAAWVRANARHHPVMGDDGLRMKQFVLAGAMLEDPANAFKLLEALDVTDPEEALKVALSRLEDDEAAMTATLEGLRGYLPTLADERMRGRISDSFIVPLADSAARLGFDAGSRWLDKAALTPEQLESFINGQMRSSIGKTDTGRWIEWAAETLPETSHKGIRAMVGDWTSNDYKAAGEWLSGMENGRLKEVAAGAFAAKVAPYDPQTAEAWALTLPEGGERADTLKSIHAAWPEDDPAGAAAYAARHGLK